MKDILKRYYHIPCIVLIALISFCFYSYLRYPLLCSDDAWCVLMAHYFQFPNDLFAWNQSRVGNIIPLMAQPFIHLFHLNAITAVSIAEYILLFIGVMFFGALFKNKLFKILVAFVFFLPFERFAFITRYYIGWEYSILAIAIYLLNKVCDMDKSTLKAKIMMISIMLIFVIDIWVIYNATFSIIVLLAVLLIYNRKRPQKIVLQYSIIGGIISCLAVKFIYSFVKGTCDDCNKINGLSDIWQAITILFYRWRGVILGPQHETMISIFTYLIILLFVVLIVCIIRNKWYRTLIKDKWIAFFLLDACAFEGIYLLSHWVLLNGMGDWYYVSVRISISMFVLLIFDRLYSEKQMRYLRYFLVLICCVGAVTPIYTMQHTNPRTLKPTLEYVNELKPLGKCGLIGDYWDSWICSIGEPDKIVSTPHQDDWASTRNLSLAHKAASMDTVYLVKDNWLESFPDTITQFDNKLKKDGEEFYIGKWTMCRYLNISSPSCP